MRLKQINESKINISDNEITFLQHHIDDAIKALESKNVEVLKSSLHDLKELIGKFKNRFGSIEQSEI